MAVIRIRVPITTLKSPIFKPKLLHLNKSSLKISSNPFKLSISSSFRPQKPLNRTSQSRSDDNFPLSNPSLDQIKPYVQSEWKPILKGWLCSVISVYCVSKIVPKVGNFSLVLNKMGEKGLIMKEGLILGGLVLVRLVANYWQQAFLWEAALNSAYKIRVYVFERVLKRDLGFFEGGSGVSAGDIAYRITSEASDVADTVYALLNTIVPSALQLTAMANQMLAVSPVLSLISAMIIPCISLVIVYFGERLRKVSRKAQYSVARLSTYLNEVLPSVFFVKASNAELCESARFKRLAHSDLSEHLRKKRMKALIPQIVQAIAVGVLLILFVASLLVSKGSFDGSAMVSFVTSLCLLIEPVQGVGKAYNELKQGEPAIERLFALTAFTPQVIEKPNAVDIGSVTGDVKFCNVSFRYGDNMPLVLNKLNLHVKPGETVALIGPSGGGKTTLTKLLLRLYDPLCGSVFIDNNDIQSIRMESLRGHVGLVSQDIVNLIRSIHGINVSKNVPIYPTATQTPTAPPRVTSFQGFISLGHHLFTDRGTCGQTRRDSDCGTRGRKRRDNDCGTPGRKRQVRSTYRVYDQILFSGTVAENIGYRDLLSGIHMEKVEHAARTANADEFIRTLSEGYETNIGPRGSILSGGQKQRLAIARAIYQNSSILIMDEATSALDSKSELLVRQAVERLMENHTVLVIAHRLETIQMADRVVLLENGKLEEVSPTYLMGNNNHCGSLITSEIAL
ncbi:hypothetical protein GIB67_012804 [Kingdonia uniflora]|uniref:ABC transporter B family member 29, chloroplastic n=1 Tax=Kingdonia uniflora TaxID=39325 RepID=A0A7J7NFG9_9MAGN|nr:hypothetical protein GIB67_012804 [Kingdonia uniflora]